MRARRRFHGYCPPAARRTTNAVVLGALDDYTSTLSGLKIHVGKTNPLMEVCFTRVSLASSMDDDDDDSSVADIIQSVVMGMCLKKDDFPMGSDAIVTSLSYDNRDGRSGGPSSDELKRLLSREEEDGVRDTEFALERASVASSVSLEISDDDSSDPPKGSFMSFRVNYLIVTTAIMLADGLQGEFVLLVSTILGWNAFPLTCCESLFRDTSLRSL
jgi:hypothetical protein